MRDTFYCDAFGELTKDYSCTFGEHSGGRGYTCAFGKISEDTVARFGKDKEQKLSICLEEQIC